MTLEALENQLKLAIQAHRDISKTRSFFRHGIKQTVTIGHHSDIEKKRVQIQEIQKQIENLLNPPEPVIKEIGEQEQDLALLQEVQIQDLENEQNNIGSLNDLLAAPISFLQTGENNNNSLIPILAIGGALLFL